MPNSYSLLDPDGSSSAVTLAEGKPLDFAREFHLKVLGLLDEDKVNNLHFYICIHPPESLPRVGRDVVLVILGDEYHIQHPYFSQLLAILRCYGEKPRYLDGVPTRALSLLAMLQFAHKSMSHNGQLLASSLGGKSTHRAIVNRTFHIPLGCFTEYEQESTSFAAREIDYAFLGSVGTSGDNYNGLSLRRFLPPPKIKARREMMDALDAVAKRQKWNGFVQKTTTFADSTSRQLAYHRTMANTKISICPRGSNYETYRFYESCRAGCVVVCEPLPDVWFYKDHPGVIVKDWSKLPQLLNSLLSDPHRLEKLAQRSRTYWEQTVSKAEIARHFEAHLSPLLQQEQVQSKARMLTQKRSPLAAKPMDFRVSGAIDQASKSTRADRV